MAARIMPNTFDYHMKLHYSQTPCLVAHRLTSLRWFDYHMKLHYSQTTHSYEGSAHRLGLTTI